MTLHLQNQQPTEIMENLNSSLIPFIAIGRHDKAKGFIIETLFCADDDMKDCFQHYAQYKFKSVESIDDYMSIFQSQLATWYVKAISGWTYMVATSPNFQQAIAVECVDELYEAFQRSKGCWGATRRANAQEACCRGIAIKYGTLGVGSASHVLMTEIDAEVRDPYCASIRRLVEQVEILKDEMADNIHEALNRGERIENLQKMSSDLLEQSKIFRKRADELDWTMWAKENKIVVIGTTLVVIGTTCLIAAATVAGHAAGGRKGAAVLGGATSVAAATVIEASSVAIIFGAGMLGARSAIKTWFWNQKLLVL